MDFNYGFFIAIFTILIVSFGHVVGQAKEPFGIPLSRPCSWGLAGYCNVDARQLCPEDSSCQVKFGAGTCCWNRPTVCRFGQSGECGQRAGPCIDGTICRFKPSFPGARGKCCNEEAVEFEGPAVGAGNSSQTEMEAFDDPIPIRPVVNAGSPSQTGNMGSYGQTEITGSSSYSGHIGAYGPNDMTGSSSEFGHIGSYGPAEIAGSPSQTGYSGSYGPYENTGSSSNFGNTESYSPNDITSSWSQSGHTESYGPYDMTGSSSQSGHTGSYGPNEHTGSSSQFGHTGPYETNENTGSSPVSGHTGSYGPNGHTGSSSQSGHTGSYGPTEKTGSASQSGHMQSYGPNENTGSSSQSGHAGSYGPIEITGSSYQTGHTGSYGPNGHTGSSSQFGHTGSYETNEHTGSTSQSGHTGSYGPTENTGSSAQSGHSGSYRPNEHTGSTSQSGHTGSYDPTENTGSSAQSGHMGSYGPTDITGSTAQSGHSGSYGPNENTGSSFHSKHRNPPASSTDTSHLSHVGHKQPSNSVADNGRSSEPTDPFSKKHPPRGFCATGSIGPKCSRTKSCKPGNTCRFGYCCQDSKCPKLWTVGGACTLNPGQPKCQRGYECINDFCCRVPKVLCPSGVLGQECSRNSPCKPGYKCRFGICCRDPVCPKGLIEGGSCNLTPGQPRCQPGYVCVNDFCCRPMDHPALVIEQPPGTVDSTGTGSRTKTTGEKPRTRTRGMSDKSGRRTETKRGCRWGSVGVCNRDGTPCPTGSTCGSTGLCCRNTPGGNRRGTDVTPQRSTGTGSNNNIPKTRTRTSGERPRTRTGGSSNKSGRRTGTKRGCRWGTVGVCGRGDARGARRHAQCPAGSTCRNTGLCCRNGPPDFCPSGVVGPPCSRHTPCLMGFTCISRFCCKDSPTCPSGVVGRPCASHRPCMPGYTCVSGVCCQDSNTCPTGWIQDGSCNQLPGQPKCKPGYECINNVCCNAEFCLSGRIGSTCSAVDPCKDGYKCLFGYCCRDLVCPLAWTEGGSCNLLPGQARCQPGFDCINGFCCQWPQNYCLDGSAAGERCHEGLSCKQYCKFGYCCPLNRCPSGWIEGGACNLLPGQARCQAGSECINNLCCQPNIQDVVCEFGSAGRCELRFPTLGRPCPPGHTCKTPPGGTVGKCCKLDAHVCPDGQDGVCGIVGDVGVNCRPGTTCIKSKCCINKKPVVCEFGSSGRCEIRFPALGRPCPPGHTCKTPPGGTVGECCKFDAHVCPDGQDGVCGIVGDVGVNCRPGTTCIKSKCCRDNKPGKCRQGQSGTCGGKGNRKCSKGTRCMFKGNWRHATGKCCIGVCPPASPFPGICLHTLQSACIGELCRRRRQLCCPEGCGRVCKKPVF